MVGDGLEMGDLAKGCYHTKKGLAGGRSARPYETDFLSVNNPAVG